MCRMLLVVTLCLLAMLATSSVMAKAPSTGKMIQRPPIGPPIWPPYHWPSCGFCYWGWGRRWPMVWHEPFQPACYRWIRICVRRWWNHCRQWAWYIDVYCCYPGILFYFPYPYPYGMYLCYNRNYIGCGGFLGKGHKACLYKGVKMCGPSYSLKGSQCVKGAGWSAGRAMQGAVRLTGSVRLPAKSPPANVKEGMMAKPPLSALGKPPAASIMPTA